MTRAAFRAIVTLLSVCAWPGAAVELSGKIILQKNVRRTTVSATAYNLRAGVAQGSSPEPRSATHSNE